MRAARNTKQVTRRVAGAAGLLVGGLAVLAGSRVLLGLSIPSYAVLRSLVLYNVFAGGISIVAGLGLWAGRYWAFQSARSSDPAGVGYGIFLLKTR